MADQPLDEPGLPLAEAQRGPSLVEQSQRELRDAALSSKPRRQRSIRQAKDSVEDLAARARSQEEMRMSPDSGSLGRGGRQFTVGNIGNNGRIYLRYDAFRDHNMLPALALPASDSPISHIPILNAYRPVVRPGIERSRQPPPPFPFTPSTPPGSYEPEQTVRRAVSSVGHDTLFSTNVTPPRKVAPAPGRGSAESQRPAIQSPPRPTTHPRANSFSTVESANRPSLDHPGTFKVIIHRPSVRRPRTSHGPNLPVLEVPIPHYRLGRPQFDVGGTAILRSSVYTRSSGRGEEPRSSFFSQSGNDRLYPSPSGLHSSYISRRHSAAYPQPLFYGRTASERAGSRISAPPTSTARASIVPIDPSMYDPFTMNPNDPTVVRYSATTNEIVAATPTRLIAHITSPSFLDYELLSDFFLTFRSFIQPRDLVSFLVARLRWAVDRLDDFGRIVRVRTFVALRHWILNYFVDDFVPDYDLRRHFCVLVNTLHQDLQGRSDRGGGDIKIVGELKKCWRRTCILYWDIPDFTGKDAAEAEILPGGLLGSRNSTEAGFATPTAPAKAPPPPSLDKKSAIPAPLKPTKASTQKPLPEVPKTPTHVPQHSQSSAPYSFPNTHTSHTQSSSNQRPPPMSPSSGRSTQVLSCSIPVKPIYRPEAGQEIPLFPHPVPVQITAPAVHISSPTPAATATMPGSYHKRSGSFTDALRDNREPLSIPKNGNGPDLQIPAVLVIPGCLVRGALYQPTAPYFDIKLMAGVSKSKSHLNLMAVEPHSARGRHLAENPAVKNILGSVRRALSNRHMSPSRSGASADQPSAGRSSGEHTHHSAPSEKSSSTVKMKRSQPLPKSQVRIDILAARILENFKEAIAQMEREQAVNMPLDLGKASGKTLDPRDISPRYHRSVTVGSRSIVIVDDTNSDMQYVMSGGLAPPSVPDLPADEKELRAYKPRDRRDTQATSASIDSVLAGQNRSPAAHVPTGFRKLNSASSPESRQSAAPAPEVPRRNPLRNPPAATSITTDPSSVSTLKRHASFHAGDKAEESDADTHVGAKADSDPTGASPLQSSETDPFSPERPKGRIAPHKLRRRPGGNLKAVNTVHSLEQPRPKSAGSVSTASQSIAGSLVLAPQPSQAIPTTQPPVSPPESDDDDAVSLKRRSISLIQTHSSQPNLRPSFEAEVAKLAALPDDLDDDGGIESALLKLEGKYEKKTPPASPAQEAFGPIEEQDWKEDEDAKGRKKRHHKEHVDEVKFVHPLPPEAQTTSVYQLSPTSTAPAKSHKTELSRSVAESEDSYSSVPLLERGLSDAAHRTRKLAQVLATAPGPSTERPTEAGAVEKSTSKPASPPASHSSIENIEETESLKRIPRGDTLPHFPTMHSSFLLDEDQSSPESDDLIAASEAESASQGVRSFFDDEAIDDEGPDTEVFTHPLRHPDTPPVNKTPVALDAANLNPTTTFNQGLPTPGLTPTTKLPVPPSPPNRQSPPAPPPKHTKKPSETTQSTARPPAHLPFILAYDPTALAQQLTIIEKDALDEIDWKELIELRWSQTSPPLSDWVTYLLTQDPRGVDLVIARFNLVVKWVKSEIVLCEDLGERTACVTQYVRVARECRRLRNYASMYQVAIALLSTDVGSLKRTWEGVPEAEKRVVAELEKVVQPLRNFQGLRAEMERGATLSGKGAEEEGCVPFIGKNFDVFFFVGVCGS